MARGIQRWALAMIALVLVTAPVRPAMGQWDAYQPQFTSMQLDEAVKALGLDAEQREIARSLHEAYLSDHTRATEKMKTYMEEIQRVAEATQNWEIWQETTEVWVDFQQYTRKLRDGMTADLKMILSEEQMPRWDRMERKFRREQELAQNYYMGMISGVKVDLTKIVSEMNLPEEVFGVVDADLVSYEIELDRSLIEMRKLIDEMEAKAREGYDFEANIEEMTKVYTRGVEMMGTIRSTNQRHADKIESLLPDDLRAEFRAAFNKEAFPDIYATNKVSIALERSLGMEDLRDDQRERLVTVKEQYARELKQANERWAEAKVRWEGERTIMSWQGGEEDPEWLQAARTLRERLDERTMERIESALTAEQIERLPGRGKGSVERPVFGS